MSNDNKSLKPHNSHNKHSQYIFVNTEHKFIIITIIHLIQYSVFDGLWLMFWRFVVSFKFTQRTNCLQFLLYISYHICIIILL